MRLICNAASRLIWRKRPACASVEFVEESAQASRLRVDELNCGFRRKRDACASGFKIPAQAGRLRQIM